MNTSLRFQLVAELHAVIGKAVKVNVHVHNF